MRRISDQSSELGANKRQGNCIEFNVTEFTVITVKKKVPQRRRSDRTQINTSNKNTTHPFPPRTHKWDREQTLELPSCWICCVKWKERPSFLHPLETRLCLIGQHEVTLYYMSYLGNFTYSLPPIVVRFLEKVHMVRDKYFTYSNSSDSLY